MLLCPTPPERLVDAQGRPYFLWDIDLTLEAFRDRLRTGTSTERAYWLGKLMRQAKPDDVFEFVSLAGVQALWPEVVRHLGQTREFWTWMLRTWGLRVDL